MIFEFHNSHLHITKTFFEIGIGRSRNFAKLLLYFYQPHLNIKDYFFFNLVRFMKPSTLRGKNMIAGLPTHGQRSHSNRKSILRFRSYLSNYISNMSMVNFSRYVRKIKISAYKHKDTPVVKTKKKTTKNLAKSSGNKKPKKKKIKCLKVIFYIKRGSLVVKLWSSKSLSQVRFLSSLLFSLVNISLISLLFSLVNREYGRVVNAVDCKSIDLFHCWFDSNYSHYVYLTKILLFIVFIYIFFFC